MTPNGNFSKLESMQGRVKFVPEGWEFIHLNKAFKIKNNLRLPINAEERAKNPGSYPYYGPTKIQGYINSYQLDGNYVLIGEDGDHFLKFKTVPMTQLISGKCTVNNHAHIIQETSKATREWFYYYFMHRDIFSFLSRQGAGRYKLNKAALEKLPVLIPPILEQKKIANILTTWDKAIETVEKLIENSRAQKKALMQQLLTGKKRFAGFGGEWDEVKLKDIFTLSSGDSKPKDIEKNLVSDKTIPVFGGNNIMGYSSTSNSDGNVILIGRVGEYCGITRFIDHKCWITDNALYTKKFSNDNDKKFITYLLQKFDLSRLRNKGGQPLISQKPIYNVKIKIPSKNEQQKIASVLSNADKEIETLELKLNCLKQEKKALMQQLLTGKRRVTIATTSETLC